MWWIKLSEEGFREEEEEEEVALTGARQLVMTRASRRSGLDSFFKKESILLFTSISFFKKLSQKHCQSIIQFFACKSSLFSFKLCDDSKLSHMRVKLRTAQQILTGLAELRPTGDFYTLSLFLSRSIFKKSSQQQHQKREQQARPRRARPPPSVNQSESTWNGGQLPIG